MTKDTSVRDGHLLPPPGGQLPTHPRKTFKGSRKQLTDEIARLYRFVREYKALFPDGYVDGVTQAETLEAEVRDLKKRRADVDTVLHEQRNELAELAAQVVQTQDVLILQEVGVYEYSHPMESSADYEATLDRIREDIKSMVTDGGAVNVAPSSWTVDKSTVKGQEMIRDMSQLLLRAYNNEASTLVAQLRPFRLEAALKRLETSRDIINRLGAIPMRIAISLYYHDLRREELRLTADCLAKKEDEKEAAKVERRRLQEEAEVRREIEAEKKRLFEERNQYRSVLKQLRKACADEGDPEVTELEEKLSEIGGALLSVEDRAANRRAGYVYVLSNVGAFGEKMVKIGMTRRLEPLDRVRELGDAAVPFRYDLHLMVFSDDAVALKRELHDRFADRRVNLVNLRREFFYLTPAEVREALVDDNSLAAYVTDFVETPKAVEWHMSENTRTEGDGPLDDADN